MPLIIFRTSAKGRVRNGGEPVERARDHRLVHAREARRAAPAIPRTGSQPHLDRDVGAEAVTDDDIGIEIGSQLASGEFPNEGVRYVLLVGAFWGRARCCSDPPFGQGAEVVRP
jgi:hypothetical protein